MKKHNTKTKRPDWYYWPGLEPGKVEVIAEFTPQEGEPYLELLLPGGHTTLIDRRAWPMVRGYRMYAVRSRGFYYVYYRQQTPDGTSWTNTPLTHLIIGPPEGKREVIDHVDHNTLDNRSANLRFASRAANAVHSLTPRRSLPRGVRQVGKRFYAIYGSYRRHCKYLGGYPSAEEAHQAYLDYVAQHHPGYVPEVA